MSDFVQTMKDWHRMCKDRSCDSCNLSGSCNLDPDSWTNYDICKIDRKVKIWVAEHPEPVYPTWLEFVKAYETGEPKSDFDFVYWMGTTSIPADIAQKLGIEPKEA